MTLSSPVAGRRWRGDIRQLQQGPFQPPRQGGVGLSELATQTICGGTESPAQVIRSQGADQGVFQAGRDGRRQKMCALGMSGRIPQAYARERQRVITNGTDPIFRLPSFASLDADPRVQSMMPCEADDVVGIGRATLWTFNRCTEHRLEMRAQRTKRVGRCKRNVHFET